MARASVNAVLRYVRRVAAPPRSEDTADFPLLQRFLSQGDEATEAQVKVDAGATATLETAVDWPPVDVLTVTL